jgi:hypothetical protein
MDAQQAEYLAMVPQVAWTSCGTDPWPHPQTSARQAYLRHTSAVISKDLLTLLAARQHPRRKTP